MTGSNSDMLASIGPYLAVFISFFGILIFKLMKELSSFVSGSQRNVELKKELKSLIEEQSDLEKKILEEKKVSSNYLEQISQCFREANEAIKHTDTDSKDLKNEGDISVLVDNFNRDFGK